VARVAPRIAAISGGLVALLSVWLVFLEKADPTLHAFRGTALAILFGSSIYLAASAEGPRFLKLLLGAPWLRSLGKYSYGLYVYHGILGYHFHAVLDVFGSCTAALGSRAAGLITSATLGVGLSLAMAVASYHLFEAPFLGLKRFFNYGRAPSERVAAPEKS
jgi:peptidoglycan/LPS O-acetylase OafA/YrhL